LAVRVAGAKTFEGIRSRDFCGKKKTRRNIVDANRVNSVNDRQQIKILSGVQLDGGEGNPPVEAVAGEVYEVYVGEAGRLVGAHLAEFVGDVIPGDEHQKLAPVKVEAPPPPPETPPAS
jgi:hypothetical protein